MNVRPAGREACECASPINQILERLDQMDADIASAQQAANTAVGTATAQAGAAAASAASAQADAAAALINAGAAQDAADDAHDEAVAAAGSAQDAADDAADALLALQNIESTIASVLATDIGAKVDKLTTAGFHLYSHNGNTQGEVAPDINPTAATIPIRDSDGKLFGADPASGATDKTLVTANWVSQTGDSAPNNLVHKTGNETIAGDKTFTSLIDGRLKKSYTAFGSSNWTLLYTRENSGRTQHLIGYSSQSIIIAVISSNTAVYTRVLTTTARQYPQPIMKITKDSNGVIGVWARGFYSTTINWVLLENAQYSTEYVTGITAVNTTYGMPVVGATTGYDPNATYTDIYDSEDFPFIR